MIRLEDIANMAGVSRTTVSNVLHGNTKRVSKEKIALIKEILEREKYVPNMGTALLMGNVSKIIGVVLGFEEVHGNYATQDPFVGEFLGAVEKEAERQGYYVMLIGGENQSNVVDIASRWNIDGLIILGYTEERYEQLRKKLNKTIIMVDTYTKEEGVFQNIGIDDYSGGYQVGEYLLECGFSKALYVAETKEAGDYRRWLGFKEAMECGQGCCQKSRYILVSAQKNVRLVQYRQKLELFLKSGAIAFSSDYNAIEAMNFFLDEGIRIPQDISIVGFDDSIYAEFVRPRLTTVHQDVSKKAILAVQNLIAMLHGVTLKEANVKNSVKLVKRDSVMNKRKSTTRE